MPQNSALMAPMTGTMAVSLGSPLLTSTAAPLGVSQNLLADPMGNVVLSEAPRVRLAESPRRYSSGPHPSAGTGPAAASKGAGEGATEGREGALPGWGWSCLVLTLSSLPHPLSLVSLSTEHPRPTQDPEPLGVTFVGAPILTSTPVATAGTPSAMTAFSYSTPDTGTQPGAAQAQVAPASVPASAASPTVAALPSAPTPAPQAASHPAQCTPHSPIRAHQSPTRPSPTSHSPPRNPYSPPRTSSSPASVNDTRGPRGAAELTRKSLPDVERKPAHRKSNKLTDSPRGQCHSRFPRFQGGC